MGVFDHIFPRPFVSDYIGRGLPRLQAYGIKNNLAGRSGIKSLARDIYGGKFCFNGEFLNCGKKSIFSVSLPSKVFAQELHSFGWLDHLRASGRKIDVLHSRALFCEWINRSHIFSKGIEDTSLRAERLLNFTVHAPFLLNGSDISFQKLFYSTISREFKKLLFQALFRRNINLAQSLAVCVSVFKGLEPVEQLVDRLLSQAVLFEMPDGVPKSRNPAQIVERLVLYQGNAFRPLMKALKFFTLDNGGLAAFQGMNINSYSFGVGAKGTSSLQGFGRISAGDSTVIIDSRRFLALEICSGSLRLATQLGGPSKIGGKWEKLSLLAAAHSAPESMSAISNTDLASLEITELSITAINDPFKRKVDLSDDGMTITGSDDLLPQSRAMDLSLRFHLDPNCHVEPSPEGRGVLVVKDIQIWHITCENADMVIEDSISILGRDKPICAKQICMKKQNLENNLPIYWTFKRVA